MTCWSVIFLLDKNPLSKIVLLKRANFKKFAPNFYTGIGGKIESGESPLKGAYRELKEETGLENITLTEFARCIVNNQKTLFYFWGIFPDKVPECNEGTLVWVEKDQILSKRIIPTTKSICTEWQKRGFAINKPFEIFTKEVSVENTSAKVEVLGIKDISY